MTFNSRPLKSQQQRQAALDHDLKTAAGKISNSTGGGLLPSTLGWGQRKIDKRRITLAPIWRKDP